MRGDRVAEWMLSLVVGRDRAVSALGDLMEEAVAHGPLWFWTCVVRTVLSLLGRNLAAAPFRLAGFAAIGWFAYMLTSLILWIVGYVPAVLLWGMGYFFTHHTGLELLTNVLRLRFDWPPPAPLLTHWAEASVMYVLAPFQVGRWAARCWPGREVVVCAAIMLVWPILVVVAPFVLLSTRVTLPTVPLLQTFVLIGALWERRASLRPAEVGAGGPP